MQVASCCREQRPEGVHYHDLVGTDDEVPHPHRGPARDLRLEGGRLGVKDGHQYRQTGRGGSTNHALNASGDLGVLHIAPVTKLLAPAEN